MSTAVRSTSLLLWAAIVAVVCVATAIQSADAVPASSAGHSASRPFPLRFRMPGSVMMPREEHVKRVIASTPYNYTIRYHTQPVDHFSFVDGAETYQQRYLINDAVWQGPGSPIFFYCGNEGNVEWFAANTGFQWESAASFGALIVFAEHRYYGDSLPYGAQSYSSAQKLRYLTTEQALADFAELVRFLQGVYNPESPAPVIVFGGSYGGMLAAWFRMKYPDVVQGAIAASAPVAWFQGLTDPEAFSQRVTEDFYNANAACPTYIAKSWSTIRTLARSSVGRQQVTDQLHLCPGTIPTSGDAQSVIDWLSNAWGTMAMGDYPYPTEFLGPMPAWPIRVTCDRIVNGGANDDLLARIYAGVSVFYNYTGEAGSCYNLTASSGGTLDVNGWDVQTCGEMGMPMSNDGVRDMFEATPWDAQAFTDSCVQRWGLRPRLDWASLQWWGRNLSALMNVVFSNGGLDPWGPGGINQRDGLDSSVVLVAIPEGAHHLDLRASNPADPQSVIEARQIEVANIRVWISLFHGRS